MNIKQTLEGMKKAGWTPALFQESFNSTMRAAAHSAYTKTKKMPDVVLQITEETAAQFMKDGSGIDGDAYDVLEQWAVRRTGYNNMVGTVFDPPAKTATLSTISSPVVLPAEEELSQDVILLRDATNERARKKALGIRGID